VLKRRLAGPPRTSNKPSCQYINYSCHHDNIGHTTQFAVDSSAEGKVGDGEVSSSTFTSLVKQWAHHIVGEVNHRPDGHVDDVKLVVSMWAPNVF
jgi:hypothetical protein